MSPTRFIGFCGIVACVVISAGAEGLAPGCSTHAEVVRPCLGKQVESVLEKPINELYNLTASEFKDYCEVQRRVNLCLVNRSNHCARPEDQAYVPQKEAVARVLQKNDFCSDAGLYAKYQIIAPCGKRFMDIMDRRGSSGKPSVELIEGCINNFMMQYISASQKLYDAWDRVQPNPLNVEPTGTGNYTHQDVMFHMCCKGKDLLTCATEPITTVCGADAIPSVQGAAELVLDAFKCKEAMAGRACPADLPPAIRPMGP